jgi:hypothetical protein
VLAAESVSMYQTFDVRSNLALVRTGRRHRDSITTALARRTARR